MKKAPLILGIIFLVLSVLVFVLAHGLRRWYSGIFFLLIGIGAILSAKGGKDPVQEEYKTP